MNENLTPEQVEAMLSGMSPQAETFADPILSAEESDILGEVGNMCMGASATTMYTILGRQVNITTPRVYVYPNLLDMLQEYNVPYIVVEVNYTEGVMGRNLLLLKVSDAALITDIMMGGTGDVDLENVELSELHLSAISEIMNQMVASSATSLSEILSKKVNISPPIATLVDLAFDTDIWADDGEEIIKISFSMEIEGLLSSELMQVMPLSFGRQLVDSLLLDQSDMASIPSAGQEPIREFLPDFDFYNADRSTTNASSSQGGTYSPPPTQRTEPYNQSQDAYTQQAYATPGTYAAPVNVQPVQYPDLNSPSVSFNSVHENLDMIIDVPLQVTVELGKARKSIKEVLGFNVGSVIVLDKLAGELVEVIVNGKLIARGEVVVIDENYGVRITEIVAPNRRL